MSKRSTTETKPGATPGETPAPFGSDRNIRVGAPFLAAAALFVSRDKARPYLRGVYIEPAKDGGALLVAADGHRLIALRDPNGVCEKPFICAVPDDLLTAATLEEAAHVHFFGNLAYVMTAEWSPRDKTAGPWSNPSDINRDCIGISPAPPIDGTFPDWRCVIPVKTVENPVTVFNVNGAYIFDFHSAVRIMNDGESAGLTITSVGNEKSPWLVTAETCNGPLFGLQMPVAIEGGDRPASIPDWIMK